MHLAADTFERVQRRRVRVSGTVQGVGFRPHLHRLATRLSLTGAAGNDTEGVWCEVQGRAAALDRFVSLVAAEAPPLSRIDRMEAVDIPVVTGEQRFTIADSADDGAATPLSTLPADVAPCAECLAEVFDSTDRRHGHAFACCTDCGPRYTVIRALPYDRARTSMAAFELCDACAAEYRSPADRRHHAQALCCVDCGPTLSLLLTPTHRIDGDPIKAAGDLLKAGRILALKGVGGYQLVCRADDDATVARLRRRKQRDEKPLALLVPDLEAALHLVELDALEAAALQGLEAPIVLAERRDDAEVTDAVAPGSRTLGVMLPATPLHALVSQAAGGPLVCTSGNRSDEPIVTDDAAVSDRLGGIADAVLAHDRVIERRADDSVSHVVAGRLQLLRRARGYAPRPVQLRSDGPVVLAVGAELKSTVCLAVGAQACVSVHLGDLEHPAALSAFEGAVADLLALSRSVPQLVVHDLHPEYLSTKFARSCDLGPLLGVQHHHAHLASCLADAGWSGPAIGVMFDGMGWGTDGTAWGGEVLIGDATGYDRVAHLAPVAMPGGTAAVREPWRMAVAHLHAAFGGELPGVPGLASRLAEAQPILEQCVAGRSIATSSMGRLFDAIAALCGMGDRVTYEGQAAIRLEQLAGATPRRYPVTLNEASVRPEHPAAPAALTGEGAQRSSLRRPAERIDGAAATVIDPAPMLEAVVADLRAGIDRADIAGAFHRWAAEAIVAVSRVARDRTGVRAVALSGGVFQNRLLVGLSVPRLNDDGFEVLLHRQVPPNDGGISLGQAVIGRAMLAGDD